MAIVGVSHFGLCVTDVEAALHTHLSLKVADFDAELDRLRKAGVP